MLQCWQKRLLNNRPVTKLEFFESGTATLDAGKYRATLIGQGGGGALVRVSGTNHIGLALGGVAGTLVAVFNITEQTDIAITIGTPGTSKAQINGTANGTPGENTTITGLPGITLIAGGGTGASVTASGYTTNRTAGVQGQNVATGVLAIEADNTNVITSTTRSFSVASTPSRTPSGQANTNWPADTKRGQSGDCGWRGTSYIILNGSTGYVLIESAN